MFSRGTANPFGGPTPLADRRLGNAYPVVKAVFEQLQKITYVAENLATLTPRDIEFQEDSTKTYIQWRYTTGDDLTWKNLLPLSDINGRTPELRMSGAALQWKYTDEAESAWVDIWETSELTDQVAANATDIGNLQTKLNERMVDLRWFSPNADGTDDMTAFTNFVTELRTRSLNGGMVYGYIPKCPSGSWGINGQLLVNVSNLVLYIGGNIQQLGTARANTLLFASSADQDPASYLSNVCVYGTDGALIDGNGQNMTFSFTPSDGTEDTSALRFNYIDNLYFRGLKVSHGAIDTCSVRKCRNWLGEHMEFVNASLYDSGRAGNGFSVTTDWNPDGWAADDPTTWGYGVLRNFRTTGNIYGYGATSFNCTGVWFEHGKSIGNQGCYSYEKQAGAVASKNRQGGFKDCYGSQASAGFYIDDNGITVDEDCWIDSIVARSGDTNNLYGNGVTLSACTDFYLAPKCTNIANAGLALFNGATVAMVGIVEPRVDTCGTYGIMNRGCSWLKIGPKTRILNSGTYGIYAHNNGAAYNQGGTSTMIVDNPWVELSKGSAMFADYLGYLFITGLRGRNNSYNVSAGTGSGAQISNISSLAYLRGVDLRDANGKQAFVLSVGDNVVLLDEQGTQGDATTTPTVGSPTATIPQSARAYSASIAECLRAQNIGGVSATRARISNQVTPSASFVGTFIDAYRIDDTNAHRMILGVFNGTSTIDMMNVSSSGTFIGNGTTAAKNMLDVGSSIGTGIREITASQIVDITAAETTLVDPTSGNITLTLQSAAASTRNKQSFVFQGTSANSVTINLGAGTFSDGTTTKTLTTSNRVLNLHAYAAGNIWAIK